MRILAFRRDKVSTEPQKPRGQQKELRELALSPNLQMSSQSRRDCSDDAGDVSSMYSTPNSSKAFAILIFMSVSKKASF